jgi:hypothetical protein
MRLSPVFLGICCLAVTVTIGWTGHLYSAYKETAFLTRALKEAGVRESVRIQDSTYRVENGAIATSSLIAPSKRLEVLRLAYEKTLARRSPLLGLPAADTARMRVAAAQLKRTADILSSKQNTAKAASAVRTGLYPTEFILTLSYLENARRAFLLSGGDRDAAAYGEALLVSIKAYRDALGIFERSFKESVPSDIRGYGTPSRILTREKTLELVRSLKQGIDTLAWDASERSACVRGYIKKCRLALLEVPPLSVSPTPALKGSQQALSRDILETLNAVPLEFDPSFGTRLIHLSSSACVSRDTEGAALFAVRSARTFMLDRRSIPLYAGNWYFLNIASSTEGSALPYIQSFMQKDKGLIPIHPLIYYECPEGARDQGAVLAVRDMVLFSQRALFSRNVSGESKERLKSLEERLSGSVVREEDAARYAQEVLSLAGLPDEARYAAEDAALAFSYKSAGLYATLFDIVEAEGSNIRLNNSGVAIDVSALNLFFTRNALGALFLAWHPSLYVPEAFEENRLPMERQPYRLYSKLKTDGFSKEQFIDLLRFYKSNYEF